MRRCAASDANLASSRSRRLLLVRYVFVPPGDEWAANDVTDTMNEREWLAGKFEEQRAHLRAVALRMLGSRHEADDAVQEVWLRLSRAAGSEVENLGGWLTTVVSRVCLDM